jgi:LacI family transcriptional regulator
MQVTLRQLARHCGVHFTTAGLALRDHPRISEDTKLRVRRAAEKLGYRQSPLVSALMARKRAASAPAFAATLGYLSFRRAQGEFRESPTESAYFDGARARAEQQGYVLEEFCLQAPGMSARRMAEMLRARAVAGLLIGSSLTAHKHLPAPLHPFALVAGGFSVLRPSMCRVSHDFAHGAMTACRQLLRAGRERIGLVLTETMAMQTNHLWTAGHLAFHEGVLRRRALPPLYLADLDAGGRRAFARWAARHRPDAVLTIHPELREWTREVASAPVAVALDHNASWAGSPGIDQTPRTMGAAAIDMLVSQIMRNELGVEAEPVNLLTPGRWVPGPASAR